jgi:hypothetical protein
MVLKWKKIPCFHPILKKFLGVVLTHPPDGYRDWSTLSTAGRKEGKTPKETFFLFP